MATGYQQRPNREMAAMNTITTALEGLDRDSLQRVSTFLSSWTQSRLVQLAAAAQTPRIQGSHQTLPIPAAPANGGGAKSHKKKPQPAAAG